MVVHEAHDGLRIPAALIFNHATFFDVIKVGKELIKFTLRNRIVFMVMAAGTAQRQSHPGGTGGFHAINDGFDAPFFGNAAAFIGDAMIPIETAGDELRLGWFI